MHTVKNPGGLAQTFAKIPGEGRGQCFLGQNLKPLCAPTAGNDIYIVEKTEKETKALKPKLKRVV
jgi:hypothetical protein